MRLAPRIVAVVLLVGAFGINFLTMLHAHGYQFTTVDTLFYLSSFTAARRFGTFLDLQTFAFDQGFGAFQVPTILHPFWWIFTTTQSVVFSHYCVQLILFAGVFVYARALRIGTLACIVCAALTVALYFDVTIRADYFAGVAPWHVAQIGIGYLAVGLILRGAPRNVGALSAGLILLLATALIDWFYAIFLVPFVALTLTGFSVVALQRRWVAWLLTVAAGGLAILLFLQITGILTDIDTYTLTLQRFWRGGGLNPNPGSMMVFGTLPGLHAAKVVFWIAAASSLYVIAFKVRPFNYIAVGLVIFDAALIAIDSDVRGTNVLWTLSAPGYFERPLIPVYVIVTYAAIRHLSGRVHFSLQPINVGVGPSEFVIGAALALAIGLKAASLPQGTIAEVWSRPLDLWAASIRDLEKFPMEQSPAPQFNPYFIDISQKRGLVDCPGETRRNRYCGYMSNIYGSPNAFEYQNAVDVQLAGMNALIGRVARSVADQASHIVIKSFGIRYVISGSGSDFRMDDLGPLHPADLSARTVSFVAAIDRKDDAAAILRGETLVHDRARIASLGDLVPLSDVQMQAEPGRFTVHARSSGHSLLLLPFQFSNCLAVSGTAGTSLIRVNGAQAALDFRQAADIEIVSRFRMFGPADCRYRDFADVLSLGFMPRLTIDDIARGKRVPVVMRWFLEGQIRKRDAIMARWPNLIGANTQ